MIFTYKGHKVEIRHTGTLTRTLFIDGRVRSYHQFGLEHIPAHAKRLIDAQEAK